MRIQSLSATNIKGFAGNVGWTFGDINIASGRNGEGKTSYLEMVRSLFGRGNPRMLRPGCESGEIRAVLEDDGETWDITRTFLPTEVKPPKIKSSRTGTVGAYARFLKEICDEVSIAPIAEAMNASEERQAQILLETIKLDLDEQALDAAVAGLPIRGIQAVVDAQKKRPALDAIKAISDQIYDQRTGVNREAKAKRSTAAQLREQAGAAADGTDWRAKAGDLQSKLAEVAQAESDERLAAVRRYSKRQEEIIAEAGKSRRSIDSEIDAKIKALEEERRKRLQDVAATQASATAENTDAQTFALGSLKTRYEPESLRLNGELNVARERADQQSRAEQTAKIAAESETQAANLEADAGAMTKALDSLDQMRERALKSIPIPNFEWKDGVPFLGGVPLSEVNTQRRAKFWLRVGAMRAKDLGIVVFDGSECLDTEHFNQLVAEAKETDLQWFLGRRDDGPFRVEVL